MNKRSVPGKTVGIWVQMVLSVLGGLELSETVSCTAL